MNYLALCQQANLEISGDSTRPTAVSNQAGRLLNITIWIARAYKEIESLSDAWEFRQVIGGTKTLSTLTSIYNIAADLSLADWLSFDEAMLFVHDSTIGTTDKSRVTKLSYRTFKDRYRSPENSPGRPQFCTVDPDGNLLFDVTPNVATYVFSYDYVRRARVLTNAADVPAFEEEYQMVIVWRAVRSFGRSVVSAEVFKMAVDEEKLLMHKLRERYLPDVEWNMVDPIA